MDQFLDSQLSKSQISFKICLKKLKPYPHLYSFLYQRCILDSCSDGSFLIRDSESLPGRKVITLQYRRSIYNYQINGNYDSEYFIGANHRFGSLNELVNHHSFHPDGLITRLIYPISKKAKTSHI